MSNIPNYNPKMEYRRLGKTGLWVSAVCLGGHWKRMGVVMGAGFKGVGYSDVDMANAANPEFLKQRSAVMDRCIESGINYVDACAPAEIMAYSRVLKGRRDKMYFGFSWYTREPRYKEWRKGKKLVEGLEQSLKESGLDYVDLWRITLPMEAPSDLCEMNAVEHATMEALELARKQGKARHTGVSSHNRTWLKYMIETYPQQVQVVLFPYTANSKELPEESIFDAIRKNDVGVFGIKPFADNSLFFGDSTPGSPPSGRDDGDIDMALRRTGEYPIGPQEGNEAVRDAPLGKLRPKRGAEAGRYPFVPLVQATYLPRLMPAKLAGVYKIFGNV